MFLHQRAQNLVLAPGRVTENQIERHVAIAYVNFAHGLGRHEIAPGVRIDERAKPRLDVGIGK